MLVGYPREWSSIVGHRFISFIEEAFVNAWYFMPWIMAHNDNGAQHPSTWKAKRPWWRVTVLPQLTRCQQVHSLFRKRWLLDRQSHKASFNCPWLQWTQTGLGTPWANVTILAPWWHQTRIDYHNKLHWGEIGWNKKESVNFNLHEVVCFFLFHL